MMSEAAKQAKREYQREYYRREGNAEKNKRKQEEYWERRAAREAAAKDAAAREGALQSVVQTDEQMTVPPAVKTHSVPAECAGAVSDTMPPQCVNCPWRRGQMAGAGNGKTN